MFSSMIINTLGLPPSAWTAWFVNIIVLVLGVVLLRNLIWLTWDKLRNSKSLMQAGRRLDLALLLTVLMNSMDSLPTQIAEYSFILFFLKLFFVILIVRQIDSAIGLVLQSKETFPQLSKAVRERWQFVARGYLVIWLISAHGYSYLPMNLMNTWSILLVIALICVAIYQPVRDALTGWTLIQSLRLTEGLEIQIKKDQGAISGKVIEMKWTHLVLESAGAKIQVRWSEVYKAQITSDIIC